MLPSHRSLLLLLAVLIWSAIGQTYGNPNNKYAVSFNYALVNGVIGNMTVFWNNAPVTYWASNNPNTVSVSFYVRAQPGINSLTFSLNPESDPKGFIIDNVTLTLNGASNSIANPGF
jgi:hypothetical protein